MVRNYLSKHQDRLDTIHEELLTVVIIILIALEVFLAFMR